MLLWIPGLPLLAAAILLLVGRRLGRWSSHVAIAAMSGSAALVFLIGSWILDGHRLGVRWIWLSAQKPQWSLGLAVDGLSWIMLVVVTLIGTMIMVYSVGYMHADARFSRFFAYLCLFCASMLGLVMADHFLLLYGCWELVGLCSYLLISFWFEKPAAAAAGRKAFITTRIGDTGLLLGIFLLALTVGDLRLQNLEVIRAQLSERSWLLTLISTLIFVGAMGKSAQIPLHVWLPDAMEGPTAVSALIHAATMVAAGVYLVARSFVLFTPQSLQGVLIVGLLTHLLAGTVALTMTDIKKVLAYSTISQLGLMMTALGLGAQAAAMFHLFTHAFFKALLFLAAGSVIHATHQQDLSQLGGLFRKMRATAILFLIGVLSMSGFPFLSGFWSKDAILAAALHDVPALFWTLLAGAVLTASYTFRLFLRCFHGESADARGHTAHSVHESPAIMLIPMAVLALGAVFAGLLGSPWLHQPIFHLLGSKRLHEGIDVPILLLSSGAVAVGFALAWLSGFKRQLHLPESLRPLGQFFYRLSVNKYYVDEAYDRWIVQPFQAATRRLSQFDQRVIDGSVNGVAELGWKLGQGKERFDAKVIDRLVNGIASSTRRMAMGLRLIQTGVIQNYLLAVVVSVVVFAWLLRP